MAKKRGNNEGSMVSRKDGRWMAQMTGGRDAKTGKPKRPTFYGKTRKEVAEKLAMLRPTTYDTYEMIVRYHIKPAQGPL